MFIHNFFDSRAVWLNPLGHKEQASKRHYACAVAIGIISLGIVPALYGLTLLVGRCCLANRNTNPTIERTDQQRVHIPGNQAQSRQDSIVVSPASVDEEIIPQSNELPTCPITLMPFTQPWILLEDGFTYEKSAIEQWLQAHPNKSPMLREIPSATLLPNHTLKQTNPVCPITRRPFQEPYYCVEDGHTYEKDEILKWAKAAVKLHMLRGEVPMLRSPAIGNGLNYFTLYPNKILFSEGIPREQKPIQFFAPELRWNLFEEFKNQEFKCVFDEKIRELIQLYASETNFDKSEEIKKQIRQRRIQLELETKYYYFNFLDLSYLDLSNMSLYNLCLKSSVFKKIDFSHSFLQKCNFNGCEFHHCNIKKTTIFVNCNFNGSRFYFCNMQGTIFMDCDFSSERFAFSGTDMQDVIICGKYNLNKIGTCSGVTNHDDFKAELRARGAKNVDSIIFRNSLPYRPK